MAGEVFRYFIRLGFLGFGGPLALIASMQKDLVENRKWIESAKFQSAFSLIKSMPGPIAFSTAVFLGRIRAGLPGALAAGFALVFPSFLMMVSFAVFLEHFGQSDWLTSLMLGTQVAALSVILISLKGLARGYEKDLLFWVFVALGLLMNREFPSSEPLIILGFGLLFVIPKLKQKRLIILFILIGSTFAYGEINNVQSSSSLYQLIGVCFKAGAFVFGSGLAIVPLLEQDVVQKYQWLTHSQFLNALALGQVTPGPVVITATAIGYYVWGLIGAVLATVAVFAASFFHMSTWFPYALETLAKQKWIVGFSRGAMAAVLGGITFTLWKLAEGLPWNSTLILVGIFSLIASLSSKIPVWLIIPISGILVLLQSYL